MTLERKDFKTSFYEAWPLRTTAMGNFRVGAVVNDEMHTCIAAALGVSFIPMTVV